MYVDGWSCHVFFSLTYYLNNILDGGFKYFFFHPYLGKWSNLANIFQMGWNHQLVFQIEWEQYVEKNPLRNDSQAQGIRFSESEFLRNLRTRSQIAMFMSLQGWHVVASGEL